jgi:hypothetical protein
VQSMLWTCDNCNWGTFVHDDPRKVMGATIEYNATLNRKQVCQVCVDLLGSATWHMPSNSTANPHIPSRLSVAQHDNPEGTVE